MLFNVVFGLRHAGAAVIPPHPPAPFSTASPYVRCVWRYLNITGREIAGPRLGSFQWMGKANLLCVWGGGGGGARANTETIVGVAARNGVAARGRPRPCSRRTVPRGWDVSINLS
jgi:hypothetical protein